MSRVTQSLLSLAAGALLAACATTTPTPALQPEDPGARGDAPHRYAEPAPAPTTPTVPIAPAQPPGAAPSTPTAPGARGGDATLLVTLPAAIDCATPPPVQTCAQDTPACREHQLYVNRFSGRWRLQCEPTRPANPIAGEHVMAFASGEPQPGELSRDIPECRDSKLNAPPVINKRVQGDTTIFEVSSTRRAACRGGSEAFMVDLGVLAAGKYIVRSAHSSHAFSVRPAGSDPGDFDTEELARLEVARTQTIGQCFGMPPCITDHPGFIPFEATREGSKMAKLMPQLDGAARRSLYRESLSVSLTPLSENRWTYRYVDGRMCHSSKMEGHITLLPSGQFSVTAPKLLSSESIPC